MSLRGELILHDELVGIIDSMLVSADRLARAPWCVRFRGQASYGKDHTDQQTFYGFRLHLPLGWPGLITHTFLAPANEADGEIARLVLEGTVGLVLGIATIDCQTCKPACARKGLSCQHLSATRSLQDALSQTWHPGCAFVIPFHARQSSSDRCSQWSD